MTEGENQFLDQYTRKLMVTWCLHQMTKQPITNTTEPFWTYAQSKGWISKKDGSVLAAGWKVGAAFLKR